jgi:hypothetical protein
LVFEKNGNFFRRKLAKNRRKLRSLHRPPVLKAMSEAQFKTPNNRDTQQGCQMVYFQAKNPNLGEVWRASDWKM